MPKFIKIGQTFSKWRPSGILDFGNSNFLTVWTVKRPMLRIRHNNGLADLRVRFLWLFKMAAAAILVFEKFEILTVCPP